MKWYFHPADGLNKYFDVNGQYPDKVFLFRDGVGEGQIPVVYNEELPRIQRAIEQLNPEWVRELV